MISPLWLPLICNLWKLTLIITIFLSERAMFIWRSDFSGSETDAALMEEQEALIIQRRMAEQLDDEDFGLESLKVFQINLSNKASCIFMYH